jgi:Undecaprenyl pyrophosphate synthase
MKNPLPQHIAIIMDGNRTWAKDNGISTIKGHDKGLDVAKEICIYCNHIGVKNLTLYAFSVQNWTRPKVEIDALFSLFIDFFDNKSDFFSSTQTEI